MIQVPPKSKPQPCLSDLDQAEIKGCLSVIVPVYNERDHVDELVKAVCDSPVAKEIILVDDSSTDGTRERLMQLAAAVRVTLVCHASNQGKGAAIRTGLKYARGEYVLIQDADLEYDPRDYPALMRPLQEGKSNVVYGRRPERPERGLRFYLGAKFLTVLTNVLYRCGIHDEATCYKAFRRALLLRLNLECRRFEFCPEVTAKLCRLGEKIWEVPISYRPRSKDAGKKIRHSDGWLAIWTLVRLRFVGRRRLFMPAEGNLPFALRSVQVPPVTTMPQWPRRDPVSDVQDSKAASPYSRRG
jgi:glycosyltransferase involved in cell wall biosynthesis